MKLVHCSLCSLTLPFDELADERMSRHTLWHSKAWVHHRNTTQGNPKYTIRSD